MAIARINHILSDSEGETARQEREISFLSPTPPLPPIPYFGNSGCTAEYFDTVAETSGL